MENSVPPCFYRISIKSLILNESGKFLLMKEENGLWDFPGGGLDHGENPLDGIRREIAEEMGLEVMEIIENSVYFLTTKSLRGKPIANVFYETKVKNLDFTPSNECIEIGFYDVEEVKNLEIYPNVQEFLKLYNPGNHI